MSTENIIILVDFEFYLLLLIGIGIFYYKKTKKDEDLLLGITNLTRWKVAWWSE